MEQLDLEMSDSQGYHNFYDQFEKFEKHLDIINEKYTLHGNFSREYDKKDILKLIGETNIQFLEIKERIDSNFINLNTFADQLTKYICNTMDAFSRIIDLYTDFDNGDIFNTLSVYFKKINSMFEIFINDIDSGVIDTQDFNVTQNPGNVKGLLSDDIKNIKSLNDLVVIDSIKIMNITDLYFILGVIKKTNLDIFKNISKLMNDAMSLMDILYDGIQVLTTVTLVLTSNKKAVANFQKVNSITGYNQNNAIINTAVDKAIKSKQFITKTNTSIIIANTIKDCLDDLNIDTTCKDFIESTYSKSYAIKVY